MIAWPTPAPLTCRVGPRHPLPGGERELDCGVGKPPHWSSHLAHNQEIAGSSPAAAIARPGMVRGETPRHGFRGFPFMKHRDGITRTSRRSSRRVGHPSAFAPQVCAGVRTLSRKAGAGPIRARAIAHRRADPPTGSTRFCSFVPITARRGGVPRAGCRRSVGRSSPWMSIDGRRRWLLLMMTGWVHGVRFG